MFPPDSTVVTVVIPARNEAGRIGALVRAVLAQDARGRVIEVIVVDDDSTDDTVDEARAAVASRPAREGSPSTARIPAASAGDEGSTSTARSSLRTVRWVGMSVATIGRPAAR